MENHLRNETRFSYSDVERTRIVAFDIAYRFVYFGETESTEWQKLDDRSRRNGVERLISRGTSKRPEWETQRETFICNDSHSRYDYA